jgi:imidazolonepropionase-like amidohydrolase
VIKICATIGVLSFEGPAGAQQYSIEELQAAADEAHRHGVRIAAHAHGTEGIVASSEAGIDSIEYNSMTTEEAAAPSREAALPRAARRRDAARKRALRDEGRHRLQDAMSRQRPRRCGVPASACH